MNEFGTVNASITVTVHGIFNNIPMWYLYGGIDGRGARITLKKSSMKKWLTDNENKYRICLVEYEEDSCKNVKNIQMLKEEEISVRYSDILYLSLYNGEDNCRIKYNNHTNNVFLKNDFESLCEKFKGFHKELPWFYEKEFRIAVKVSNEISEQINNNPRLKIAIAFNDELLSELEIMVGPEQAEDIDFNEYKGLTKFVNRKIQRSRFNRKINMNLKERMCKTCDKGL